VSGADYSDLVLINGSHYTPTNTDLIWYPSQVLGRHYSD